MNALQMQHDHEREFTESVQQFFDGHLVFTLNHKIFTEISAALQKDLNVQWDILDWWMWELDFGRETQNAWIKIDKEKLNVTDAGDLYDFMQTHNDHS